MSSKVLSYTLHSAHSLSTSLPLNQAYVPNLDQVRYIPYDEVGRGETSPAQIAYFVPRL